MVSITLLSTCLPLVIDSQTTLKEIELSGNRTMLKNRGPTSKRDPLFRSLEWLCADQFETSTFPPPGKPRACDCASCPGRGEFERCLGGVGNLNQIYLLFRRNTPVSFSRFLQGLTDLQDRISPLFLNYSFKRVFKEV